jgi:hypothetical protein
VTNDTDRPTYRISTWDPGDSPGDDWGWNLRHAGLTRWQLRAAMQDVRDLGYIEDHSVLIERED